MARRGSGLATGRPGVVPGCRHGQIWEPVGAVGLERPVFGTSGTGPGHAIPLPSEISLIPPFRVDLPDPIFPARTRWLPLYVTPSTLNESHHLRVVMSRKLAGHLPE